MKPSNETEISCGGRESAWPAGKAFYSSQKFNRKASRRQLHRLVRPFVSSNSASSETPQTDKSEALFQKGFRNTGGRPRVPPHSGNGGRRDTIPLRRPRRTRQEVMAEAMPCSRLNIANHQGRRTQSTNHEDVGSAHASPQVFTNRLGVPFASE